MIEYLEGNRVTLLESGIEYFPALESEIERARAEIHLETYLYENDATGRRITGALCAAARRGVRVQLLVDGFGAREMPAAFGPALEQAGVLLLVFRPEISRLAVRRQRLRRMHRKLAVIDARVAFIGGINVIDDLNMELAAPPRHDYAVRVEGPLLGPIHREASRLWARVAWVNLRRQPAGAARLRPQTAPRGTIRAGLAIRDNLRHRSEIEDAYLDAIEAARREVMIANAYFLPGIRFRHALMRAARRGVHVVLLVQGRVEHALQHYAARALYGSLLEAGVQIFEYHWTYLHAKVAVIDGRWATVGSSNIDPFSLMLAREANVIVLDRGFAGALLGRLRAAIERGARMLPPEQWRGRPWWRRARSWIAYGVARFLIGMLGLGGRI